MGGFAGVVEVEDERRRPQGELQLLSGDVASCPLLLWAGDVEEQVDVLLMFIQVLKERGDVDLRPAPASLPPVGEVQSVVDPGTHLAPAGQAAPLDAQVTRGVDRCRKFSVQTVQQGRLQELLSSPHLIQTEGQLLQKRS